MSVGEVSGSGTEVELHDQLIGRLRVRVPESWTPTDAAGRNRVVFVDVETHVGEGFLPNVSLRIDPSDESDTLPAGSLVLSDRTENGQHGPRRVRMLLSELPDQLLMQQVTTLTTAGITASVVASASESQWASLADSFDSVSASAVVEEPAG